MKIRILFILLLCASVSFGQTLSSRLKPIVDSKGSIPESERLHRLFDEEWRYRMEQFPEDATATGYPGQNDRWTDLSFDAITRRKVDLDAPLKALRSIDRAKLDSADQLNYDLFERNLLDAIEAQHFPTELMPINQMEGAQQNIAATIAQMPLFT